MYVCRLSGIAKVLRSFLQPRWRQASSRHLLARLYGCVAWKVNRDEHENCCGPLQLTSTVFFMLRGSRRSSKGYAPLSMTKRMTAEDHRSAAGPLYFAASRLLVSTCGAIVVNS